MRLVRQSVIKRSSPAYTRVEHLCHLSKNLYNAALYMIKQKYESDGTYLSYYDLWKIMCETNNSDYRALQNSQSQQTLKLVDQNYKSFFKSLKSKNVKRKVSPPKYLKKNGLYTVVCATNGFSQKKLSQGIINPGKTDIEIPFTGIDPDSIQQVKFVPKNGYIMMEVIYNIEDHESLPDNGNYMAIDLGIKNLATCTTTIDKPFIINGKGLCSINQYYNKEKSRIQSELEKKNGKKTSKRLQNLTNKRNRKIKDQLHKASRYIIDYAVSRHVNTIIIGKNDGWKQDVNIGEINNQNFVCIPHTQFVNMLQYKAELAGIRVVLTEESYTSLCSFVDKESIRFHKIYAGKRTKTKTFVTSKGMIMNADVNGSLNIMRKGLMKINASDDAAYHCEPVGRGFIVNPVKISDFTKFKE